MAAWMLRLSCFLGMGMNSSPSHRRAMALLGQSSPRVPMAGRPLHHGPAEKFPEEKVHVLVHQGAELHISAGVPGVQVPGVGLPLVRNAPVAGLSRALSSFTTW